MDLKRHSNPPSGIATLLLPPGVVEYSMGRARGFQRAMGATAVSPVSVSPWFVPRFVVVGFIPPLEDSPNQNFCFLSKKFKKVTHHSLPLNSLFLNLFKLKNWRRFNAGNQRQFEDEL